MADDPASVRGAALGNAALPSTPLSPFAEHWPALSALLDEALDLAPAQQQAWLEGLSGERARHREALRALLSGLAGVETDDFLMALPTLAPPTVEPAANGLVPGGQVGPYRLIAEIGRGGMGTVWLAERADLMVKRRVALKLPRVVWGDAFAERLAREREILSTLEHEHIARLYDAGVDAQGRPFLAMEYVEGEPLDAWCRARTPGVRERVALLQQVMAALAHAHARLVVHRDLKPGNILVTADGQVKLLDFGIAKLLDGDRTRETALTQLGGRALTLDYASPEQIRGEPLGTASDIYSLAVVAYELLTGARPYRLKRGSAAELEEAIGAVEPARASDSAADPRIARELRGDLDAILLKALKKRPAERYPTMDAFAQDLQRHLDGAPVEARPDRLSYRAAKFVRRYRLQVIAGAVMSAALMAGASVALWQAHEARLQAQRAQAEAATATAVQDFLQGVFRANSGNDADPDKARATTARELLDIGAERIDTDLRDAPEARFRLLGTLAEMYGDMAELSRAADLHRKRADLARATWGDSSPQAAAALAGLAGGLAVLDLRKQALDAAAAATAILDRIGDVGSHTRFEVDLALATVHERGDFEQGLAAAQRAAANARARGASVDLVSALLLQSEIATLLGKASLSRDGVQEAIRLVEADPRHGANNLSTLYVGLADAQDGLGELAAAEGSYRRSITLSDERNRIAPIFLHTAERQFGSFLRRHGKLSASVEVHRAGYDWARANPSGYGVMVPTLIGEYGRALVAYGRVDQGLAVLDEAVAEQSRHEDAPEVSGALALFRAEALIDLGRAVAARAELQRAHGYFDGAIKARNGSLAVADRRLLVAEGRADEALAAFQTARRAKSLAPSPDASDTVKTLVESAWLSLEAGDAASARSQSTWALEKIRRSPTPDYERDNEARATLLLGKSLLRIGPPSGAVPVLERAVALQRAVHDPEHSPAVADARRALAEARRLSAASALGR